MFALIRGTMKYGIVYLKDFAQEGHVATRNDIYEDKEVECLMKDTNKLMLSTDRRRIC